MPAPVQTRSELGDWLHAQRTKRHWDIADMARQLINAAGLDRYWLPKHTALLTYIGRWERGEVVPSDRYRFLYCLAFGINPDQFGPRGFNWKASHTNIRPPSGDAKLVIYLRLDIGTEGNAEVSIDSVGRG